MLFFSFSKKFLLNLSFDPKKALWEVCLSNSITCCRVLYNFNGKLLKISYKNVDELFFCTPIDSRYQNASISSSHGNFSHSDSVEQFSQFALSHLICLKIASNFNRKWWWCHCYVIINKKCIQFFLYGNWERASVRRQSCVAYEHNERNHFNSFWLENWRTERQQKNLHHKLMIHARFIQDVCTSLNTSVSWRFFLKKLTLSILHLFHHGLAHEEK